jgi:hypothetical protein
MKTHRSKNESDGDKRDPCLKILTVLYTFAVLVSKPDRVDDLLDDWVLEDAFS